MSYIITVPAYDWRVYAAMLTFILMTWGMAWPTRDAGFWGAMIRIGMFLSALIASLLVWALVGALRC